MVTTKIRYATKNPAYVKNLSAPDYRYVEFQKRGPLGAVLHSIGTPQPSAEIIANNFDDPNAKESVHMILQPDGLCLQLSPLNYRMWHVGGDANQTHLGIEMSEPDSIAYDKDNGYALIIKNHEKAKEHVVATYWHAVSLFADLCTAYGWDPLEDGIILSHRECHARGIGSNHGDPEHLWEGLGTGFTMDSFRADVAREMKEPDTEEEMDHLLEMVKRILDEQNKELMDNDCGAWSEDARQWAIELGIIAGIEVDTDGKTNYAWQMPITREQLVTMLYRFAKKL